MGLKMEDELMGKIKFRAWDKECKKLYNVNHMDYLNNSEKSVEVWTNDIEGGHRFIPDKLEQFIGLVDSNGIPIYEGDIVDYRDGEFSFVAKVVRGTFYFYMKNSEDNYVFEDLANDSTGEAGDLTIVGNIHINKDLLEGE